MKYLKTVIKGFLIYPLLISSLVEFIFYYIRWKIFKKEFNNYPLIHKVLFIW